MKQNILIVDDEVSIQESLSGILRDEGYEISLAPDGNTALKIVEEYPPISSFWISSCQGWMGLKHYKK